MSKTPFNKKYLEIDSIRVYHDKTNNTIQIISKDPDLKGKPFQITLQNGSPSENSLRELLIDNRVIDQTKLDKKYFIPKFVNPHQLIIGRGGSGKTVTLPAGNQIPLGLTHYNHSVMVDVDKAAHTLIVGPAGSGKTILANNIAEHCLQHENDWEIYTFTLNPSEHTYLKGNSNIHVASNLDTLTHMVTRLNRLMELRYNKMLSAKTSSLKDLEPSVPQPGGSDLTDDNKHLMVIIDGLRDVITLPLPSTEKELRKAGFIEASINQLLRQGRAVGIHLTVCEQSEEYFSTKNFNTRIIMWRSSEGTSLNMFGTNEAMHTPPILGRARVGSTGLLIDNQTLPNTFSSVEVQIYSNMKRNKS